MQRVAIFAIALMMVFAIGIYQQAIALDSLNESGNMSKLKNGVLTMTNESGNMSEVSRVATGKSLDLPSLSAFR